MTSSNRLSPTGHSFGRPPLSAAENSITLHSFTGSQTFQPVPPATGAYPYRLDLASVIGADAASDSPPVSPSMGPEALSNSERVRLEKRRHPPAKARGG